MHQSMDPSAALPDESPARLSPAQSDRIRAAERILLGHAQWSDRMIADVAGLAPGTVAGLRRRLAGEDPRAAASPARVGRDGRVRPVDPAAGRRRAVAVIEQRPQASLRQIASLAGVSTGTARDVRDRVRRGEDAVPNRTRRRVPGVTGSVQHPDEPAGGRAESLRLLRLLLWMLQAHAAGMAQREQIVGALPAHWAEPLAALALDCAEQWRGLASSIDDSARAT